MLKCFNLQYYMPGLSNLDDMDRAERDSYYRLLKERKAEEAKPKKKE